ncbi:MAG TPA: helix-turn-helix transcriptional regulator [bacterium]|nr:helix-turn-helix transcriptional regulator [bacterium]
MDIGTRLYELRQAKGYSQGDIQHRTGLLRCYVSRVENGHTLPNLETLEKWAKALDVELYQLFFAGEGKPEPPPVMPKPPEPPFGTEGAALFKVFSKMSKPNRRLLLDMARKMATTERRK